MTDNEIIKALECCGRENCNGCPYRTDRLCHQGNPMIRDACDLIKCQKAEIERYKKYYETMESELDSFRKDQAAVKFLKNKIRAEAIKEFAERVQKHCTSIELNEYINTLVEEMTKE